MKFKKIGAVLFAVSIMLSNHVNMSVFAENLQVSSERSGAGENTDTTGLIDGYSLSISASAGTIYLSAYTYGTDIMASIGFKNITIQHSSNGTSGWTAEYPLADDLDTNTYINEKINEPHSVTGGYYYRVVLDHYAKETGFWFPSSESIPNTSNVVWVP